MGYNMYDDDQYNGHEEYEDYLSLYDDYEEEKFVLEDHPYDEPPDDYEDYEESFEEQKILDARLMRQDVPIVNAMFAKRELNLKIEKSAVRPDEEIFFAAEFLETIPGQSNGAAWFMTYDEARELRDALDAIAPGPPQN